MCGWKESSEISELLQPTDQMNNKKIGEKHHELSKEPRGRRFGGLFEYNKNERILEEHFFIINTNISIFMHV